MSDFDDVLERLVADPSFVAALAADPDRALAGYRLTPDEVALLRTQVSGDAGGQRGVEVRANQSSLFGMLGPIGGLGGLGEVTVPGGSTYPSASNLGPGTSPPAGSGPAENSAAKGFAGVVRAAFDGSGLAGPGGQGGGSPIGGATGFGQAQEIAGGIDRMRSFGPPPQVVEGFGPVSGSTVGPGVTEGFGEVGVVEGFGGMGKSGQTGFAQTAPPDGYRTQVDVDGDGRWDEHVVRGRADGGVDILVDVDGDGRIESAAYDTDRDGFFDKRMYDDNGDGWLDRTVRTPPEAS